MSELKRVFIPNIPEMKTYHPRDLTQYKCWYCLDRGFVFVPTKWSKDNLPKTFTKDEIVACLKPSYKNYAVPCDCCQKREKTFVHIYGISISRTNYGRALVAVRQDTFTESKELPSPLAEYKKMPINTEMGMN